MSMQYFYRFEEQEQIPVAPDYSTTEAAWIKGDRMHILMGHKKKGSGSRPHRHPNEQFIYVLKGHLKATVEDQEKIVSPGGLIHVPSNALHSIVATTDEDVQFFVAKDTSWGITGIPENGEKSGGYYKRGYEPSK
ncbi:hypothetical protein ES703_65543 [subsurface metagenome]